MFQQTILDILAITECGPPAEAILGCLRSRILAFEPFESGELLALSPQGRGRFVFAPGLSDIAETFLRELGDEATLRIDTPAELRSRGLEASPGLSSLLILRLEAPAFSQAALVLGHRRAWSFAAAPLSRLRTLGNVALRLMAPLAEPSHLGQAAAPGGELARLRNRISSLESEIIGLKTARRPGSDRPQ